MKKFKDHLLELMKDRNETISSISKATGLPISTLSEWCHGRKPLLDEGVVRLSRYLGVSLERLVCGPEESRDLSEKAAQIDNLERWVEMEAGVYRIRIEKIPTKTET